MGQKRPPQGSDLKPWTCLGAFVVRPQPDLFLRSNQMCCKHVLKSKCLLAALRCNGLWCSRRGAEPTCRSNSYRLMGQTSDGSTELQVRTFKSWSGVSGKLQWTFCFLHPIEQATNGQTGNQRARPTQRGTRIHLGFFSQKETMISAQPSHQSFVCLIIKFGVSEGHVKENGRDGISPYRCAKQNWLIQA